MAVVEVQVPDIGDFESVDVIEVLVKPGDTIRAEQSLVTVESDKSSMEIPSSQGGVVRELKVALGDKIGKGTVLLTLEAAEDGGGAPEPAPATAPVAAGGPAPAPAPAASAPAAASIPTASAPAAAPAPAGGSPAASADGAATVEARVPDIGDFDGVAVIELLVAVGDTVAVDQSLITVESDKSSMEIPSTVAGRIVELRVAIGDTVAKDSLVAIVAPSAGAGTREPAAGAAASGRAAEPATAASGDAGSGADAKAAAEATSEAASASAATEAPADAAPPPAPPAAAPPTGERIAPTAALPSLAPAAAPGPLPHASPSIRKLARELGVPLAEVAGSGPNGRITHDDVRDHVRAVMAAASQPKPAAAPAAPAAPAGAFPGLLPWPQVDFAKFGPVERVDRSRIKKLSAANLHRNWVSIPHVTNHDDADVTALEALRVQLNKEHEKAGVKTTLLAFILKACAATLQKFPEVNASLDGDQLVLKRYLHLGFAADTPNGLMVPVVRDVDKKGVLQISAELGELAKKARDGKLGAAEMTGGTFSVSSLGGVGGRYFTPIINAPEVAILGVGKSATEPVWDGAAFQPRLRLPLSLSYDHRVIDGAAAARFNSHLCQLLGDFRRVVL